MSPNTRQSRDLAPPRVYSFFKQNERIGEKHPTEPRTASADLPRTASADLPRTASADLPRTALHRLRSFLDTEEPQVILWLEGLWIEQQHAISYEMLREAVLHGETSITQLQQWQSDYSKFVSDKLAPVWLKAMTEGARQSQYTVAQNAAQQYISLYGAELVTNIVNEQRLALRAMLTLAAHADNQMSPDSLAMMIRPVIGLTKQQALASFNYYTGQVNALKYANPRMSQGVVEQKAREAAYRYASRQHRYRATSIARTELSAAYNHGAYNGLKNAQDLGYVGECVKVWVTGDDERTCPTCGALDGVSVGIDDMFPGGILLPPYHPRCRCAVAYEISTLAIERPSSELQAWESDAYGSRGSAARLVSQVDANEKQEMSNDAASAAEPRATSEALPRATSEALPRATSEALPRATSEALPRAWSNNFTFATRENLDIINPTRSMISDDSRGSGGMRRSPYLTLSDGEIDYLLNEIKAIKADVSVFRFNYGSQTGYNDSSDTINVRADIFNDKQSTHPRDRMSERAVLAHEYYGHRVYRGTKVHASSWNDEFRASYMAIKNSPGLSDEDRMYLMLDAIERARSAGVSIKYNDFMRRILYGF